MSSNINNNRWDNIKKKYNLNNNITSSTVQKFLDLNFTDCVKDELCGVTEKKILDPALIMELRHEAVKQARKPWKEESTFKQKEIFMENIKSHNNFVDSRMIDNELSKFKMEVRKMNSYSNRKSLFRTIENDHEEIKTSTQIVAKNEISEIDQFVRESEGSSSPSMSEDSLESIEYIKVSAMPKSHDFDQEYFDAHDEGYQQDENPMCYECCTEQCEFSDKHHDSRSFYSLPNLTLDDVDDLMIISKFQSVMSIDKLYPDCPCCEPKTENENVQNHSENCVEIKNLDEKIEDAETEKMLIVKRMELEEKNYQQLVITHGDVRINEDENLFECERIVCDLFQVNQDLYENKKLVRVYFKEWLQKVTVAKILKTNSFSNEDRIKKINGFLNKIRLEQNRGVSKIVQETPKKSFAPHAKSSANQKDYEHKLKMQQDIIELQKLKIKRQEQLITEIKLAKFSEMVKQSKKDLKVELINAKKVNAKLRAKARSIQLVANIPTDPLEEERRLLLAQGLIVPKFLAKMQQRAEERLMRHEEASQRRLRMQQDKDDKKLAAENAKRLEDEEAKRKRLLELREKRRQEKLAKQLKDQERERYLLNLKRARDHYSHNLMKNLGFHAFELLIRLKRINHKKSTNHRRLACMRRNFLSWHKDTKSVWDSKRDQADKNYEIALQRRFMKIWIHIHSINQSKFLVAIDWYEVKTSEKLFNKWIIFTEQCKMIEHQKMNTAIAHFNCQIKWKLLECWRRFPDLMKIEREAEVRRQKWRMKVWDLLPDYKPSQ